MHVTASFVLLISLVAAPATVAVPTGVDLARLDGWKIVVAPDAIASEAYAAEEFRDHLVRAGGPTLLIVREISSTGRYIYIGPSKSLQASDVGFDVSDFGPDDLRIVVRDEQIAIAGGR